MINGNAIKRTTLTIGVVEEIRFDDPNVQSISLGIMATSGKVSYKVNGVDITDIDDTSSNYIDAETIAAVNIERSFPISKLTVVSNVAAPIQWEIRK